jgi:hypothetical protein
VTQLTCSNIDRRGLMLPFGNGGDTTFAVQAVTGDELLTSVSTLRAVPLLGALPLFATGLGALGLLGWRRKKKTAALAA